MTLIIFPIKSIQVDDGSEFMGLFEELCKELAIPQNMSSTTSTLVPQDSIYFRFELQKFVKCYNTMRPHQALKCLTPSELCSQLDIRKNDQDQWKW